jgi:predicted transcriptional regulator
MDINEILKRLRLVDNKMAFAKASGVSRATLYRILEGWPNPTVGTMRKIEKQLDKPRAWDKK